MALTRTLQALLVPFALAAGACASVDRSAGTQLMSHGSYGEARAFHEALLADHPGDAALDHDEAGVMALLEGDVAAAHRHFREAFDDLDDLGATTAETVGAFVGPADSRRWKGEPYERCMNAYYLGVTYWLQGDVDNAAAAFKAGVLRDADSREGTTQSDFALLWYLMGEAQRAAFHQDRGAAALERAHALRPTNPWTDPARAATGNVVLLVETGLGPRRVASGPHGAWVRFARRQGTTDAVDVRVATADGQRNLGRAEPLGEIYRQAVTRGDKVIDHVNQGKAVFKDAAVVGGAIVLSRADTREEGLIGAALLLVGLLTPAETDLRFWASLPDEVLVLTAELPPGPHTLELEALDASGRPLPGTRWTVPVEVRSGHVALAWTRVVPGLEVAHTPARASSMRR